MAVSESVPGQVDKKSGVPQERGVSRRRKGQAGFFFSSTFLSLSHIKWFCFSLSRKLMITQLSLNSVLGII